MKTSTCILVGRVVITAFSGFLMCKYPKSWPAGLVLLAVVVIVGGVLETNAARREGK